ncbi:hypothetical protein SAMN05428977_104029 [Nitrosomonas sp. Nm166]|nr:hypothetical protein SAMN05428977_104029 [Nitrosomonas sp. Nm166]
MKETRSGSVVVVFGFMSVIIFAAISKAMLHLVVETVLFFQEMAGNKALV